MKVLASVYRSRRPPGSESRPQETPQDPIATKEGWGWGGSERKGQGYLVDPQSRLRVCFRQAAARGAGRPRPPAPFRPRGHGRVRTCFLIGTSKKFRGAPMTTGPFPVLTALPESASGLEENDEEPRPKARTHAGAGTVPPPPPPSSTHDPYGSSYGTPRLGKRRERRVRGPGTLGHTPAHVDLARAPPPDRDFEKCHEGASDDRTPGAEATCRKGGSRVGRQLPLAHAAPK